MPHGLLNLAEPTGPSTLVPAVIVPFPTPVPIDITGEQPAKVVTNVFVPGIKALTRRGIFIVAVADSEPMIFVAVNVTMYELDENELSIWIVNETVFVSGFIPLAFKFVEGFPVSV